MFSSLPSTFSKRLAAVGRAEDAALRVRAVRMAEHRDEDAVGIARIDGDLRDLLAVAQAEVRPGLAGVGGLVDAVADGEVGALQAFAAADVDDVRVRRRDRERADRAGRLVVEDRLPGAAVVGRSSRRRRCTRRCRRRSAGRRRPAADLVRPPRNGPDGAPAHFLKELGIVAGGPRRAAAAASRRKLHFA